MRVIAIDDNQEMLDLIETYLREAGYNVVATSCAKIGFQHVEAGGVDTLVTDILMPDMDGIEVIKSLRRSHPNLWIVAISGGGSRLPASSALTMSQAFGADRTIYKPFTRNELLAAMSPA